MLKESQNKDLIRLPGFDPAGEVFMDENHVLRGIYPNYSDRYREILNICKQYNLFDSGIIQTREFTPSLFTEDKFSLVLEHERIPFITYPHEWAAGMLKDAALFHIELFQTLNLHGLTIKDFHPFNILFKNTTPMFVDFTSIIPFNELSKEEYLKPPRMGLIFFLIKLLGGINALYYFQMHQRMFLPYFIMPLYLMQQSRHSYTRRRMRETTLNATVTKVLSPTELFRYAIPRPRRWKPDIISYTIRNVSRNSALFGRDKSKNKFWEELKKEIKNLTPSLKGSAYSSYYEEKKEKYGFEPSPEWTYKNRGVYESIKELRPSTVLDVGCNTGWFSILSAKQGCRVIAIDNDEACTDLLYFRAKHENLDILPLVLDITDIATKSGDISSLPMDKRLKCDMLLALAILHHLVLGQGKSFEEVIGLFNMFARKHLILEFVPIFDERIVAEPQFFKAFHTDPAKFNWYTQDNLLRVLRQYYTTINIRESFPKPRTLIICSK